MSRLETHIIDDAWRRGLSVKRTRGGYVITSKRGDGYVLATPADLQGVESFLETKTAASAKAPTAAI